MKFNTKKLLSVTSSLLIAAQQCFIAMPAGAVDVPSEAETYAQQIGLELNSSDAESALSDLIEINDSDLGVSVDDNNNVTQINGLLSEDAVDNSNDAKDIIAKASELLGIDNVNREIRLDDVSESEYNRIYVFKQYYQGLEMVNSYITVVVNKETGEAKFLNSSVVSDFSINTTPAITAQQAIDAVASQFGQTSCTSHKLAIYSEDNETFNLAWELDIDLMGFGVFYVDAITGEILNNKVTQEETSIKNHSIYSNDLIMNENNRILPQSETYFNVDITQDQGEYKLHDVDRNIYVVNSPDYYVDLDGGIYISRYPDISDTVSSYNPQFTDADTQAAVVALYNVERTYDFYKNTFNYNGYDGNGGRLCVIPSIKYSYDYGETRYNWANAAAWGDFIAFGDGVEGVEQSWASDLDVVAHEFTHTVTRSKVGWHGGSTAETGALSEAYSDIMGEYADTTREWQNGTDFDMENTGKDTTNKKKWCVRDLTVRKKFTNSDEFKKVEIHAGSRVISHAAYWMDKLGIDETTGAKIWFTSLDYLPYGANKAKFIDCRNAVLEAIDVVVTDNKKRDEYTIKAKNAFNRVHVYDPNELLGDLCKDGQLDTSDLTILQQVVARKRSLPLAQRAQADLNCDFKINQQDVDILSKYISGEITEF